MEIFMVIHSRRIFNARRCDWEINGNVYIFLWTTLKLKCFKKFDKHNFWSKGTRVDTRETLSRVKTINTHLYTHMTCITIYLHVLEQHESNGKHFPTELPFMFAHWSWPMHNPGRPFIPTHERFAPSIVFHPVRHAVNRQRSRMHGKTNSITPATAIDTLKTCPAATYIA